jgi:acyl-CoA thioesterase I
MLSPDSTHPSADSVRVACVGDSITEGAGVNDPARESYPATLLRTLGIGWDVRNFGVSGTTLLRRGNSPYVHTKAYTAALLFRPEIVVIKLGTNDSKRPRLGSPEAPDNWGYRDEYVGDYVALTAAFRHANPAVRIFLCTPVPAYPGNWGIDDDTIRDEVVPRVREVAQKTDSQLIDLYTALTGHPSCFPDTVHPNADGAALIATEVRRHLLASA